MINSSTDEIVEKSEGREVQTWKLDELCYVR